MPNWFRAPILTACLCSILVSQSASADTPLADYKTDAAVVAVKAYATADATKADADKLLDGIKGLVDAVKVKEGAGLEVKDGKGTWTPPLKKPALTPDESKKVKDDLPKFLAAALKADKKLSEADQAKLVKDTEIKTGMAAPPTQGLVALTAYTTQMARDAVKAYVSADATKAEADATLKDIAALVDLAKVKDGSALEVKDGKSAWAFSTKDDLKDGDKKKVNDTLDKLLESALKADKKLSDADVAKLAKGTVQATQVTPAGTLTLDKLDRVTATATVKAFFEQTPQPAAIKPLDDSYQMLDVAEIKRNPNLEYDKTAKQLVWHLQYTPLGADVLVPNVNEKPEDEVKKEAARKKLRDELRPVLKAALQSEKNPAKRLTDGDLDKVVSGARIELRKQIGLREFLREHLNDAVTAHLAKNPDAFKAIADMTPKAVDVDDLKKSVTRAANSLTVRGEQKVVWRYRRVYRSDYLKSGELSVIGKTLTEVLLASARDYKVYEKSLNQEGLEEFEKVLRSIGIDRPEFVPAVPDKPLKDWVSEDFRAKVLNILKRANQSGADNAQALQLREELRALGVAVGTDGELRDLVAGLTFKYAPNGASEFTWNYYAAKGMDELSAVDKQSIRKKLIEVLERALAFPRGESDDLSMDRDELVKQVYPALQNAEKTKIEFKTLGAVGDVTDRDLKEMLSDYLTQRNPDEDTRRKLAEARRYMSRVLDFNALVDESKMAFTPPEGQTAGKFSWVVRTLLGRPELKEPEKKDAADQLISLLIEAVKNPQRARYKALSDDTRSKLIDILARSADGVEFKATELANVYEALTQLQDRLERAEARIAELEKGGGSNGPAPVPVPVLQYQTFTVPVPAGLFGCRTRMTTITVPVR